MRSPIPLPTLWFGVVCVCLPLYLYALFSEFWLLAMLVWGLMTAVYVVLLIKSYFL